MAQMTRAEVRLAQQRLNALGFRDDRGRPLKVDGIVGPRTMAAMQASVQSRQASGGGAGGPPAADRSEKYVNPNPFVMPVPRARPGAAPPGLGALMGMPAMATAGAPSFQRPQMPPAPPSPSYDMATAGPPGLPIRFGGVPMRDPDSSLWRQGPGSLPTDQFAREMQVSAAMPRDGMGPVGLPTPPPLGEFAPPMPPPTGMGGMAGNGGMGPMPPMDLAGAGVIGNEADKFPMNSARFADGLAPPPQLAPRQPPAAPMFPQNLIHELGIDSLTDTASRVFNGPGPVPAQAQEPDDLARPRVGARVLLKNQPYEFDGQMWRPAQ